MIKIVNTGAQRGSEAFLFITPEKSALIDSGFAFCAENMVENIEKELQGRPLDYVLLTHSHYDHASGSAYCCDRWPDVKIIAGVHTAKIFSKPTAKTVMREMNDNVASIAGVESYPDKLDKLRVDVAVSDGDIIDMGSRTLIVWETPGHTRCSIAFYCPEEKLLISNETMGVFGGGDLVAPAYLVEYEGAISFINRAQAADIESILVAHHGILTGNECHNFLKNALFWNEELKRKILEWHHAGMSNDQVIENCRNLIYKDLVCEVQPVKAFELNASYTIPMIIKNYA